MIIRRIETLKSKLDNNNIRIITPNGKYYLNVDELVKVFPSISFNIIKKRKHEHLVLYRNDYLDKSTYVRPVKIKTFKYIYDNNCIKVICAKNKKYLVNVSELALPLENIYFNKHTSNKDIILTIPDIEENTGYYV